MTHPDIIQYEFDPQTHLLIGAVEADAHPHVGMFLRESFCTDKIPPTASKNEAVFFDELLGDWRVIPDYRGVVAYDIVTGEPTCIHQAGALPKHLSLTPPQPSAADLTAQFAVNKAAAFSAVDQFHANTVQQLAGNPMQVEKDTWAMKLSTANAVIAKAVVSAEGNAFMTAAGFTTPSAQSAWAAKVQTNAAKFAGLVGLADALRTTSKAAITAATDQASLDAAQAANKAAAVAAIAALPKV